MALLICSVYGTIPLFWLVVHPFVNRWRESGRRSFVIIILAWLAFIAIALLSVWPFRAAHLYRTWWAWVLAAMFFVAGFLIYCAALRNFHRSQLYGLDELEPGTHREELITTGIRSRVRHPVYVGHLCEIVGWCAGTGLVALYAMAIFAAVTGAIMIRFEDRELEARFGEAYREYRRQVPAIVPRLLH